MVISVCAVHHPPRNSTGWIVESLLQKVSHSVAGARYLLLCAVWFIVLMNSDFFFLFLKKIIYL